MKRGNKKSVPDADPLQSVRLSIKGEAEKEEKLLQLRQESRRKFLRIFIPAKRLNPEDDRLHESAFQSRKHLSARIQSAEPSLLIKAKGESKADGTEDKASQPPELPKKPTKHKTKAIPNVRNLRKLALEDYSEPAPEPAIRVSPSFGTITRATFGRLKRSIKGLRRHSFLMRSPRRGEKLPLMISKVQDEKGIEAGAWSPAEAWQKRDTLPIPPRVEPENVRAEALQDYSELNKRRGLGGFFDRFADDYLRLRPIEKTLLKVLAGLVVFLVLFSAGFILFRDLSKVITRIRSANAVPTPAYPYPVRISLPDGLGFDLHQGFINDGIWFPDGAEWLQGTEICRWVALPWSRNTEKALRAINPGEPITLFMSNADELIFNVESVQLIEGSKEQVNEFGCQTPNLYVFLIKEDSDSRWIIVAVP